MRLAQTIKARDVKPGMQLLVDPLGGLPVRSVREISDEEYPDLIELTVDLLGTKVVWAEVSLVVFT